MASRKTLLKSARARAARLEKRGFSVTDVGSLSTQKLVALKGMSSKAFEAAIAKGYKTPVGEITYAQYKAQKAAAATAALAAASQERARASAISKINRRIRGYQKSGYGITGIPTADLVTMSTKELVDIANKRKSAFFASLGATKTIGVKPIFGRGGGELTISAEKWAEFERLKALRRKAAEQVGAYAPEIDIFTTSGAGFQKLLDYVESQATPAFWENFAMEYRERFLKALDVWSDYLPEVEYISHYLKSRGEIAAREQAQILQRALKAGVDVASISYIYDGDISGSLAQIYKLFKIPKYKGAIHDNQKGT